MDVKITTRVDQIPLHLSIISTSLVGLYIALFQSGIVSYAGAEMNGAAWLSRGVLLIYGAISIIAAAAVFNGRVSRRVLIPVLGFVAIAAAPLALSHGEIGPVTKSYVISLVSLAGFSIAAMTTDLRRVAQFSASLLCVVSICCMLDACFFDGFSNTSGRAAFLYINPNIAGIALLLGAVASAWSVPLRWLPSFLILVAGAVFATLSRSAIIMAAITLASCALLPKVNYRMVIREFRSGIKATLASSAIVLTLLGFAVINNHAFMVAMQGGMQGAETAVKWTEIGNANTAAVARDGATIPPAQSAIPATLSASSASHTTASPTQGRTATIEAVEANNSASARALLAERAWHQFWGGPATGIGLEKAFAMAPHNSFLLFAVAFGYFGWLIIPAFAALILYLGGRRGIPAAILIAMASMVSHDLLFAMPLVSSLALILPSAASKYRAGPVPDRGAEITLAWVAISIAALCLLTDIVEQNAIPAYEQDFSGASIKQFSGHEYYAPLPAVTPRGVFRLGAESREYLGGGGITVQEGEQTLPLGNRSPKEISTMGHGRFGFHNMWVLLSSTDGTDPSANGRVYHVSAVVILHPLFLLCVAMSLAWAALYSSNAFGFLCSAERRRKKALLNLIGDRTTQTY